MYPRYWNAPLLLLLWQLAPLDGRSDGRLRVDVGVGTGFFGYATRNGFGCAGEPVQTRVPGRYSSVAVAGEYWATDRVRFTAVLGSISDETGALDGNLGGVAGSFERERFGIGLGLSAFGGAEGSIVPAIALRAGRLNRPHLRADYGFPSATMGLSGLARVGLGVNQGRTRGIRLFVGGALTPATDTTGSVGFLAQAGLPIGRKLGISLQTLLSGSNEGKTMYSLGMGVWVQP